MDHIKTHHHTRTVKIQLSMFPYREPQYKRSYHDANEELRDGNFEVELILVHGLLSHQVFLDGV